MWDLFGRKRLNRLEALVRKPEVEDLIREYEQFGGTHRFRPHPERVGIEYSSAFFGYSFYSLEEFDNIVRNTKVKWAEENYTPEHLFQQITSSPDSLLVSLQMDDTPKKKKKKK